MSTAKEKTVIHSVVEDQAGLPPVNGSETALTYPGASNAPHALTYGEVGGDVQLSQMSFPRLQVAYGVGGLAESFNPGDLVLDKEYKLASKNEPIQFICCAAVKFWREYLDNAARDAGALPREFATDVEVKEAGGTTTWGADGSAPTFSPALRIRMLIRKPKDTVCGLFGVRIGDHDCAPAEWSVDKQAYRRAGEPIVFANSLALRNHGGLTGGVFELRTISEKSRRNTNVYIVPIVRMVGHTTEAERQQLATLFGPRAGDTATPF